MPSLFHIIDEDSLSKNPNLKFDPQNPSAHLKFDHPKFQELKEGLTPEQIEILENVTQVDGFEVDGSDRIDDEDSIELVDPYTGKPESNAGHDEFTLDELGFVDPANLKKITMEAFDTERLDHVNGLIQDRYVELTAKGAELFHKRMISRLEANNVNSLLGGRLYDNVVMESFTQYPTVVNYNVVMEEIDAGKAALAAGGAIIGATILYKLVKWFLNSWNKNAVASGAIGANVKAIQERRDRLRNADDVIATAQQAYATAAKKFKDTPEMSNRENSKFAAIIKSIGSAENLKDNSSSKEFLEALALANVRANLTPHFSNLWLSIITNSSVQVGTGFQVNSEFVSKMQAAVNACQSIANAAQAKIENISNTSANQTVDSDKDQTYKEAVETIKAFAVACGFNLNGDNFNSSAPEFAAHIATQVVGRVEKEVPDRVTQANITIFNEETFAVVTPEFTKQVEDFGETLKTTSGKGFGNKDKVNVGANVQRDSRLAEYEKAANHFRGAMHVMRGILAIRNNVGRGLVAMNSAYDFLGK